MEKEIKYVKRCPSNPKHTLQGYIKKQKTNTYQHSQSIESLYNNTMNNPTTNANMLCECNIICHHSKFMHMNTCTKKK